MSTNLWRVMMEMASLISVLPGAFSMDRPFDFAYPFTQTQPEMGGTGGGGKTRNGLMDWNGWDDTLPGNLDVRDLKPEQFIPFIRELEALAIHSTGQRVMLYWSTVMAGRLLPKDVDFPTFSKTINASVFSEDVYDFNIGRGFVDKSVVCLFSDRGSVFIEFQSINKNTNTYRCYGSIDSTTTVVRLKHMFDRFRLLDSKETNRVVIQLTDIPFNGTDMSVFGQFQRRWNELNSSLEAS